jgi:hypothetical protein
MVKILSFVPYRVLDLHMEHSRHVSAFIEPSSGALEYLINIYLSQYDATVVVGSTYI